MADKAVFTGTISLGGLISIPMKVVKATHDHDVAFHEYHAADGARSGRKTICKGCGLELDSGDIVKGVEVSKGKVVTLTAQDLETLPLSSGRSIDIDRFVSASELSPLMFEEAAYFVTPEPGGEKPFSLLVEGARKAQKVAIGKITMRQREHICALAPTARGGMLMSLMRFSDEIREMPQVQGIQVAEDELELIGQVIKRYSKPFDHALYKDNYTEALKQLVSAKLNGTTITAPVTAQAPVVDIMAALRMLAEQEPK